MPRNPLARCNARHLRIRRLVQFILVGAVYHNALTNRAALLCRALRRVARLCSRMVSDTVNTRIHGRPTAVLRKKNPLPFPHSLSSANFAVLSQKETGFKRVETLVSILLPTAVGTANSCAPQSATLCLIQAKNSPPRQGEPPVRFKCPGYPVPDDLTRKGIRFQDASALRRTALPAHRV